MRDKQSLIDVINQNISKEYKASLLSMIKPPIRVKTQTHKNAINQWSQLGGLPTLLKNRKWPLSKYDNEPHSFIGQIDFSEIKPFDEDDLLPPRGFIYFFFNLNSGDDGHLIYTTENNHDLNIHAPEKLRQPKIFFLKDYSQEVMETWIKHEKLNRYKFSSIEQVRQVVFEYIERCCNRMRIHSSLGYKTPLEKELELIANKLKNVA